MSPDAKAKDEIVKDEKTREAKPKELPKRAIKIGHILLDKRCCVIRSFDEMQQARAILAPFKKSFPQFSLPFMFEDDLPRWPVRVAHPCWYCDGTHARSWSFMHDEDTVETVHICESCRNLAEIVIIAYPKGKRTFKLVSSEEIWDEIQGFENSWKPIAKRAKTEESGVGRFFARLGHLVAGPADTPEEGAAAKERQKEQREEKKADDKPASWEEAAKEDKDISIDIEFPE